MKDGRTHLAHKAEHSVDLSSGAVVAITLQAADLGDTTTIVVTLKEAQSNAALINQRGVEEVVADKGYHSNEVLVDLRADGVRSYIPEPERGLRNWDGTEKEQKQVYGNRRRMSGRRGKDLQKLRTALTERILAHMYETGGMRRTHLKGQKNILKRLLFHAVGFNLALLIRKSSGIGKPRTLQGLSDAILLVQIAMTALAVSGIEAIEDSEPAPGSRSLPFGLSRLHPQ
jgi:transposase